MTIEIRLDDLIKSLENGDPEIAELPQLLVAANGTIIDSNQAFQKVWQEQCSTRNELKPATIFSLVHIDHLSQLFTQFSQALRLIPQLTSHKTEGKVELMPKTLDFDKQRLAYSIRHKNYSIWSQSFPCRQLPKEQKENSEMEKGAFSGDDSVCNETKTDPSSISDHAYYVTLTLLNNRPDIPGRLFHGVLTKHMNVG